MKQKKLAIYFIGIIITLLAPLPLFNTVLLFTNNTFELKKLNKKHLFSTDNVESHINYLFYKTFKISLNEKQTIVGKDDFLFLGNKYAKVIDKTQGLYPYTQDDIDKWTNKLKQLQGWYESRNIKFILVIAPNKHSIHSDKLPKNISYIMGETITDDILEYANKKNINILDLRDILREEKVKSQLYFTTDTHWNNKAAAIGFESTIQYINSHFRTGYKTPEYNLSDSYRGSGDLAGFLKIKNFLPYNYEKNYNFNFKNNYTICHGNISKKHKLRKCEFTDNLNMYIGQQDQYMINTNSLNKDRLLLLCDSFGTAHSKLYNATFSTIWKFHYDHINGMKLANFIQEHTPNIVIYQVIERGLYNQEIVKTLSNLNSSN